MVKNKQAAKNYAHSTNINRSAWLAVRQIVIKYCAKLLITYVGWYSNRNAQLTGATNMLDTTD